MSENYSDTPRHGITKETPKNILLNAATIHAGLSCGTHYKVTNDTTPSSGTEYYTKTGSDYTKFTGSTFVQGNTYYVKYTGWNFAETIIGATQGGTKISIKPEIKDIEVDGALVKVKGLAVKMGETASIETTYAEVTAKNIASALVGSITHTQTSGFKGDVISPKKHIEEGDYISGFGVVGYRTDGRPLAVIFDYALCTSGFETETKNKEAAVVKATFECYADIGSGCDTLPYKIYDFDEEQ